MLLGSASMELLAQSSESLAGRLAYVELAPLVLTEVVNEGAAADVSSMLWLRGGFPDSFLARSDAANFAALNEALDHLASGDLTHRITVPFSPKAEGLKANFNAAAERVLDAMKAITATTDGVSSGADEIARARIAAARV